jgi:hypothetical protein
MPATVSAAIAAFAQKTFGEHPISVFDVVIHAFHQYFWLGGSILLLHLEIVEDVETVEVTHSTCSTTNKRFLRAIVTKKIPAVGKPRPVSTFFRLWMAAFERGFATNWFLD